MIHHCLDIRILNNVVTRRSSVIDYVSTFLSFVSIMDQSLIKITIGMDGLIGEFFYNLYSGRTLLSFVRDSNTGRLFHDTLKDDVIFNSRCRSCGFIESIVVYLFYQIIYPCLYIGEPLRSDYLQLLEYRKLPQHAQQRWFQD